MCPQRANCLGQRGWFGNVNQCMGSGGCADQDYIAGNPEFGKYQAAALLTSTGFIGGHREDINNSVNGKSFRYGEL